MSESGGVAPRREAVTVGPRVRLAIFGSLIVFYALEGRTKIRDEEPLPDA